MAQPIAEAYVELSAKTAKYKRGIQSAKTDLTRKMGQMGAVIRKHEKQIRRLGLAFTAAGAAIVGSLTAVVLHTTKMGDEFHKMSLRVGESASRLSALKFAADISGAAMNDVEVSLRRLSQHMNDFANGTGEAKDTFEALGIEVVGTDGQLRSSIDVMTDVADELNKLASESQKTAFAQELFGRSGSKLLPLLKEGSAGIKELTDRAAELGLVIDDKAATAAAEFNDKLTELRSSLSATAFKIGNVLLPVLQPLIEQLTDIVAKISKWTEENPKLTKTIAAFAGVIGGLMVVGGPMLMLAPTLVKATVAMKAMIPVLIGLKAQIAFASVAMGLLVASMWSFHRVRNALKDTGANTLSNKLEIQEKLLSKQRNEFKLVQQALKAYALKGLEPATAKLGDLNIASKDLGNALRSKAASITNVNELLAILTKRYKKTEERIEAIKRKMAGVTEETGKAAKATKALNAELDILAKTGEFWWLKRETFERERIPPVRKKAVSRYIDVDYGRKSAILDKDVYRKAEKVARETNLRRWQFVKDRIDKEMAWYQALYDYTLTVDKLSAEKGVYWKKQETDGISKQIDMRKAHYERFHKGERKRQEGTYVAGVGYVELSTKIQLDGIDRVQRLKEKTRQSNLAKDKAALKAMQDEVRKFLHEIRLAVEDLFVSLVSGEGKDAWKQFWDDLAQIAIRKLAEIAAEIAVTQAAIAILGKGTAASLGIGTAAGAGAGAALAAAAPVLGPLALAAGVGYGIYKMGNFAEGGIVRKPTLAMIGESGPEAVIPLGRAQKPGMGQPINFTGDIIFYETDFANMDRTRLEKAVKQQIIPIIQQAGADGIGG